MFPRLLSFIHNLRVKNHLLMNRIDKVVNKTAVSLGRWWLDCFNCPNEKKDWLFTVYINSSSNEQQSWSLSLCARPRRCPPSWSWFSLSCDSFIELVSQLLCFCQTKPSFNHKCQFVLLKTNAQDFYRLLHCSTWEVFELGSRVNFFSLNLVLIIDLPRLVLCLQLDFVN